MGDIADQSTSVNTATAAIPFMVSDSDTAVTSLTLSGSSSNPTLVPNANIVFVGSGANRTVTVTPAAGRTGTATITVTVSDGSLTASDTFVLTVSSAVTGTVLFTNASGIVIPDVGAGTPYPSTINVSGLGGTISQVTVRLNGFSQTWPADVDVLLVGPTGQKAIVMSDVGGGNVVSGVTLTLSDGAAAVLPQSTTLVSGTFRPTDYTDSNGAESFPAPAAAGPYAAPLSAFNGLSANGTWSLYVVDDGPGDQGSFAGGWSLTITTVSPTVANAPSAETPPQITSIWLDVEQGIRVTISGELGFKYALEASIDLLSWTEIDVQNNATGSVVFRDRVAPYSIRFYRAVTISRGSFNVK
jgi:hypothetical protein